MLKLFSPTEAKSRNDGQVQRDQARIRGIQDSLRAFQTKQADAESSFNSALARHREQWANEEKEYEIRKDQMDKEVKSLEKRKEEAVIPIKEREQKAYSMDTEADKRLSSVKELEIELEKMKTVLTQRLDDCSEREQSIQDGYIELERHKTVNREEDTLLELNRSNLSKSIQEFNIHVSTESESIEKQKVDILLQERSYQARKDLLDTREQSLLNKEIQLKSERIALDEAWKELQNGK